MYSQSRGQHGGQAQGSPGPSPLACRALAWALHPLIRVPSDPTLSVTKRTIGTL